MDQEKPILPTTDIDQIMLLTNPRIKPIQKPLQSDKNNSIVLLTQRVDKIEKQLQKLENILPLFIRTQIRKQTQNLQVTSNQPQTTHGNHRR